MAYSAIAVANELLQLAQEKGVTDVTPMKLQKLVYFAHGWWFGVTDEPLINEQIEAWRYGPVIPELYEAAKSYGNQPISSPLTTYDVISLSNVIKITPTLDCPENELNKVLDCLRWVLDTYGAKSGIALSNLSHIEGGPWAETVRCEKAARGTLLLKTDIAPDLIKDYFSQEYKKLAVQQG